MKQTLLTFATVLAFTPLMATAQMKHGGHGGHGAQTPAAATSASPSTKAFEQANERMHQEMMIKYTGNADKYFIAGMIPHHRGAVDMAAIVIEFGSNHKVRALAEQIIREQEKELVLMEALLKELNR